MNLDPGDRAVAKKAARDAAVEDLLGLDEYIKDHPTLDKDGYPADPVSAAFEALYSQARLVHAFDDVELYETDDEL